MENKIRKEIASIVNKKIKSDIKEKAYKSFSGGEIEVMQDKYITEECEKRGTTSVEFYAADGHYLNMLLTI